MLEPTARAGLF